MAYGPETRAAVRAAFIYDAVSMEAAGAKFGVDYSSARRWKTEAKAAGDDWDRARAAARLSSQGADGVSRQVLEEFVTLFQSTITQLKSDATVPVMAKAEALSRLADAYYKTMRAVAAHDPKLNKLAIAMEVLQLEIKYVRERHPDLIASLVDVLDGFGKHVTEVFG